MKIVKIIVIVLISMNMSAQKYFTKEGSISFFSKAPLENIEAHNEKATAVIDLETGDMEWAVLIKAFSFEKALMQEHFNENYMESSKYPKATFKGKFTDYNADLLQKDGSHKMTVTGELTIHGETQNISTPVTISRNGDGLSGKAEFSVKVQDYKIDIPSIVRDKIAKEIKITVEADFQSLSRS